ncbi:uncharacterized protein LAESUDRAFT_457146 [Laetiporus sulphureus 93-53]|uniref:F-box domain-containing protein n=1 Tax=Laetiporus sulphureus 93-53 TaxID=1314785 RepID=A0A165BTP7_9APHY|nr:uncharacterized protein LAESUDRAFT_457146 [Laetiporus sulphureus 93-53]KZT01633.1 hypothetical protein LAESUDRAFT_457146 [Laetiporus sulphureus 93-53]
MCAMKSIKRKLARLADRTRINSQWLVRIVKGKGKAGRTASSEVEATVPQLPIEVWENVIDYLWDDDSTLRRCVLVCRAWYPPSRFHFYTRITIRSVRGVKAYAKMLKQTPELSERAHDMTIVGDWGTDRSALSTAAILLARKLPRLEQLHIEYSDWNPWTMHSDIFLLLPAFSSISCLDLRDVTFPSINVFGHLVCALPGLVELKCFDLEFTHDYFHHDTFGPYHNRVNIRSLSLKEDYHETPEKLTDFLAHPCFSSRLQRLIIDDLFHVAESQHRWKCQRLLDAASSSLSELRLSLVYFGQLAHSEVSTADSALSFTHNTSLQSLWLAFPDKLGVFDLDTLYQVLLSITSGQLREIVILFKWFSDARGVNKTKREVKNMLKIHESVRHKEIDNYLSSASFSTLSKVEFALECYDTTRLSHNGVVTVAEEQWKQQLLPLFPRLTERGILSATVREPGYGDNF